VKIDVHINHVVIDRIDLGPRGGRDLEAALHATLTELLSRQPPSAFRDNVRTESVSASPLQLATPPDGATLGAQVARSLHATLPGVQSKGAAVK